MKYFGFIDVFSTVVDFFIFQHTKEMIQAPIDTFATIGGLTNSLQIQYLQNAILPPILVKITTNIKRESVFRARHPKVKNVDV